jgi:hypothetical protein
LSEPTGKEEESYYDYADRGESLKKRRQERLLQGCTGLLVAILVFGWVVAQVAILFLSGFHFRGFNVSEGVLLALIGSSTVSIVSLLAAMVRHLFPATAK